MVRSSITRGIWQPGDQIPTEYELMVQYRVSRMTVNRALRELTQEHLLVRVQGSGTFVAEPDYHSTLCEVKSIAEEILARGNRHSSTVLLLAATRENAALWALELPFDRYAFHSRIVHNENEQPVQLEDRYVDPERYPDYLEQNFWRITPSEYLTSIAPLQRAEYTVSARLPTPLVRHTLAIEENEPCLVLQRRTWVNNHIASATTLWHPGSRYHFTGAVNADTKHPF